MQVQKQSLRGMSIENFIGTASRRLDSDSSTHLQRFVQKGVFEEIWGRIQDRVGNDVAQLRVYQNVGLLGSSIGKITQKFKRDLAVKPIVGHVRTRVSFHDDIRFIMTLVDDSIYLLMDNAALDSRMATVMLYDEDAEGFVVVADSLLEFVFKHNVEM